MTAATWWAATCCFMLASFLCGAAWAVHPMTRPIIRCEEQAQSIAVGAFAVGVTFLLVGLLLARWPLT
jgi:hypothetical protein